MPGKVVKFVAVPSLALIVLVHAVAAQQRERPSDASKGYPLPTTALPVERQDETPPVDRHGDPLPLHAVSRLGTIRFRGAMGSSRPWLCLAENSYSGWGSHHLP